MNKLGFRRSRRRVTQAGDDIHLAILLGSPGSARLYTFSKLQTITCDENGQVPVDCQRRISRAKSFAKM
jgi:hypothetical protein